jgi:hypothetical protein
VKACRRLKRVSGRWAFRLQGKGRRVRAQAGPNQECRDHVRDGQRPDECRTIVARSSPSRRRRRTRKSLSRAALFPMAAEARPHRSRGHADCIARSRVHRSRNRIWTCNELTSASLTLPHAIACQQLTAKAGDAIISRLKALASEGDFPTPYEIMAANRISTRCGRAAFLQGRSKRSG